LKKLLFLFCVFAQVLIGTPMVKAASYGWGFKRNNEHKCPDIGFYAREIEGTSTYYVGSFDYKHVYITFDAGYDNGVLAGILDVLKEKKIKSTFFVTGDFIKRESELLKRIVNEGHLVGNHTWSHRNITTLSFEELSSELGKVEIAYRNVVGIEMPKLFRPPAGSFNREALLRVQKLGYSTVFWSIAFKDWDTDNQRGGDYSYRHIMDNHHNGAIILLHSVSRSNLEALSKIIDSLRHQGYEIQNLDSLIRLSPPPVVFFIWKLIVIRLCENRATIAFLLIMGLIVRTKQL